MKLFIFYIYILGVICDYFAAIVCVFQEND